MKAQGFALILVIWALLLMTTLAAGLMGAVRAETSSTIFLTDQVRAEAAVHGGQQYAIRALLDPSRSGDWIPGDITHEIQWPDARLRVQLRDVNSRINPNVAPREILEGLFETVLIDADSRELAEAVIAFRDDNRRGIPAPPRDRPPSRTRERNISGNRIAFSSVAELGAVDGMLPEFVQRLAPYLSVHSSTDKISARSATAPVIAAIPGVGLSRAEQFTEWRKGLDPGQRIRVQDLPGSPEFTALSGPDHMIYVETTVTLASGHILSESTLIRLDSEAQDYKILSRLTLPSTR